MNIKEETAHAAETGQNDEHTSACLTESIYLCERNKMCWNTVLFYLLKHTRSVKS